MNVRIGFCASIVWSVQLLGQDALPEGKGRAQVLEFCSSCHGIETVTHVRNTHVGWKLTVDDMITRGGAGSDDDAALILGYLLRNFGKPVNVNKASAKELRDGLGLTAAEADAIVKYREANAPFKEAADVLKVPGVNGEKLKDVSANLAF